MKRIVWSLVMLIAASLLYTAFVFVISWIVFGLDFVSDKSLPIVMAELNSPKAKYLGKDILDLDEATEMKADFIATYGVPDLISSYYISTRHGYYRVRRFSKVHYAIKHKLDSLRTANPKPIKPNF